MNTPFSETLRTLNRTAALLNTMHEALSRMKSETRTALCLTDDNERSRITAVNDATDEILHEIDGEKADRRFDADALLRAAEHTMCEINDPHYHRTAESYRAAAARTLSYNPAQKTSSALFSRMRADLRIIQNGARKIRDAFFTPDAAGLIGTLSHDFRKEIYTPIAEAYVRMCRCADALEAAPDLTQKADRARANCTRKTQEIKNACAARRAVILQKFKDNAQNELNKTNAALCAPPCAALFAQNAAAAPLSLGTAKITLPSGKTYTAPRTCTALDRSVLFLTDGTPPHALFCSLALDLLKSDPNAVIHLADPAHCGSAYHEFFSEFLPSHRVNIWHSGREFTQSTESLCRIAAQSIEKNTHYIFIESAEINVPEQALDDLLRLVRANVRVRVLLSVSESSTLPHGFKQKFPEFLKDMLCCTVKNGGVFLSEDVFIIPPPQAFTAKHTAALSAVTAQLKRAAVLPLGPRLPNTTHWQKQSSERGIFLPVGKSDAAGQPVMLSFTEENPYALIIGDVNSGKSALLHTIALQIFANYTPDEVKLAVGDFKEGAEFALYGTAKLPFVDAVIENDDPDAATSFLAYYVSELHRRQSCFSALSAQTGRFIRKYETYRAVQREIVAPSENLPRILLLIDEYQSLFEGNPRTAVLLSELIRKGRTYGIHIVMASQRGVSDSARSTFTSELKDYFSTRFVFRCPPSAARRLFSERCADTGRENSGIAAAVLLKTGHALFHTRAGQTERDTVSVQCYYANDALITKLCTLLPRVNGTGSTVLLRYNAPSRPAPSVLPHGMLVFGDSVCLHKDRTLSDTDSLKDDTLVSFTPDGTHILCTGSDLRVPASVLTSAARFAESENLPLHVFCSENHPVLQLCRTNHLSVHTNPAEQKSILTQQLESPQNTAVNVFLDMSANQSFTQPLGALRPSPDAALFKSAVAHSRLSVVFERRYKTVRTEMPFLLPLLPVNITAVGDSENVNSALPDAARTLPGAFDTRQKNSIHAYYCNKSTEKYGKVILFSPE